MLIFTGTDDYLGHSIVLGKLHVSNKATEAVKALHYSSTRSKIWSFWGFWKVYRRFLQNIARLTVPMNRKLKNGSCYHLVSAIKKS